MGSSVVTGTWYRSKLYQLYIKIPPDTVLGRWYIGRWYISRYDIEVLHVSRVLHEEKNLKLRKLLYVSFWRYTVRNSVHEKSRNSVKFRGISRNYTWRNSAEFRRNFSQFRPEYGIDRSDKKQTEFRGDGIPWTPYRRHTGCRCRWYGLILYLREVNASDKFCTPVSLTFSKKVFLLKLFREKKIEFTWIR